MDAGEIGPGDVVVAVRDLPASINDVLICTVPMGARTTVLAVARPGVGWGCCGRAMHALTLEDWPLPGGVFWCGCGWRKIGGSQADTMKLFAGALTPARELEPA